MGAQIHNHREAAPHDGQAFEEVLGHAGNQEVVLAEPGSGSVAPPPQKRAIKNVGILAHFARLVGNADRFNARAGLRLRSWGVQPARRFAPARMDLALFRWPPVQRVAPGQGCPGDRRAGPVNPAKAIMPLVEPARGGAGRKWVAGSAARRSFAVLWGTRRGTLAKLKLMGALACASTAALRPPATFSRATRSRNSPGLEASARPEILQGPSAASGLAHPLPTPSVALTGCPSSIGGLCGQRPKPYTRLG